MCILVVDDEPAIRELLVEALSDEGYLVASVSNGQEALNYLRRQEKLPDVILLDLMMPVMDGWGFRREQQRDQAISAIPVVVLSAVVDAATATTQLAVRDFIAKPIHLATLFNTVARLHPPRDYSI